MKRLLCGMLTLLCVVPAVAAAAEGEPDNRPSILFAIADDWGWPHAGAYGDPVVQTPTFDRLAREGVLFHHAYVAAPSCTASRGGILSGQAIHRLEEGGNLWSLLPAKFQVYPDLLEDGKVLLGVNVQESWKTIEKFRNEVEMPFPVLRDNGAVSSALGISLIPALVIVDKEGRVDNIVYGFRPWVRWYLKWFV